MQNDWKWMRGYYLEAAREKIAAGFQAALERWGRCVHGAGDEPRRAWSRRWGLNP